MALKEQLDAAGFDTSGLDESSLIARLDAAGYDTSSLQQSAPPAAPSAPETGLDKAVRVSEGITGTLGKIAEPVTSRIGKALMAVKEASDSAADKEAELAGQKGVLPISAMVPAIPSMLIDALGVPDRLGTAIAEKGGEYGMNPELAAGLGTAVSMAPDIAAGAAGIAKRAAIAEGLSSMGRKALSPVRAIKDLATGPSIEEAKILADQAKTKFVPQASQKAEELGRRSIQAGDEKLLSAKEKLADVRSRALPSRGEAEMKAVEHGEQSLAPLRQQITKTREALKATGEKGSAKLKQLDDLEAEAKIEFERVENEAGVKFKSTPKFESFVADRKKVARLAQKLDKLTPEVAKELPSGKLQVYRKLGQEARGNVSEIGNAQIQKGREIAAQELSERIPALKEVRSKFHNVKNAREDVVASTKKTQAALKSSLTESIASFRQQEAGVRDMLKRVRSTERQALAGGQKGEVAASQKELLQAQQELKRARQEASDLVRQAKGADDVELQRIAAEGDQIIQKAMKRSKILKALKVAGLSALGIKGASLLP